MNKNILIVLAGGFVIAILVAVLVQASLSGTEQTPVLPEAKVQVLVAAADLKPGHVLVAEDMRWQDWPEGAVFGGAIVRKGEEVPLDVLSGKLARAVAVDEPLLKSAVVPEEGVQLSANLPKGMRAVSLEVKAHTMVGGFVIPGDYVDVILTYSIKIQADRDDKQAQQVIAENIFKYATETVLHNVKVLAVDQTADRGEEEDLAKVGKTVTIETNQRGAEIIALAQKMGTLTLSLRGLGDDSVAKTENLPTVTDARLSKIYEEIYAQYLDKRGDNISGVSGGTVRIYSGDNVSNAPVR